MSEEQRYDVSLTWDEIDQCMSALRCEIYRHRWEDEAKGREPSFVAEIDQLTAVWWAIVHRMGDARRVAHGYAPLSDDDYIEAER